MAPSILRGERFFYNDRPTVPTGHPNVFGCPCIGQRDLRRFKGGCSITQLRFCLQEAVAALPLPLPYFGKRPKTFRAILPLCFLARATKVAEEATHGARERSTRAARHTHYYEGRCPQLYGNIALKCFELY